MFPIVTISMVGKEVFRGMFVRDSALEVVEYCLISR